MPGSQATALRPPLVIPFKKYMILKGILGSPWIGFENFMRFSEQWGGGNPETLIGSFICLWEPQQAVGFKFNQAYQPPRRNWSFDTDFLSMDNLPPGTPFTVHFEKTVWGRKID